MVFNAAACRRRWQENLGRPTTVSFFMIMQAMLSSAILALCCSPGLSYAHPLETDEGTLSQRGIDPCQQVVDAVDKWYKDNKIGMCPSVWLLEPPKNLPLTHLPSPKRLRRPALAHGGPAHPSRTSQALPRSRLPLLYASRPGHILSSSGLASTNIRLAEHG